MDREVSGTVIEAGPNVATLRIGDRVAMKSHIAAGIATTAE
jgi:threonine dehydrogenase-like Zn-dependent dehydrogenase